MFNIAVGPQNALILRQGLMRSHIGTVILLCSIADCLLIALGNLGVGAIVTAVPWILEVLRYASATYLLWFAFQSFRTAFKNENLSPEGRVQPLRTLNITTLTLTFLNPGVYLDTVALLDTMAYSQPGSTWVFSIGAMIGSVTFFTGLGLGAQALAPLAAKPQAWKIIDISIGVVITIRALRLIFMC
nr:LysE family transporter [Brevibacterium ravenspurgense]